MDVRDKSALYEIKHKYGGSIKLMSGANVLRYKLRHKKGIIDLINAVNGLIRNSVCINRERVEKLYKISLSSPVHKTFEKNSFRVEKRYYSCSIRLDTDCLNQTNKLNPYYITGFADGESFFLINIRSKSQMKTGYSIELVFNIKLHLKDKELIENIQNYFGVGTVGETSDGCIQYRVCSIKDLSIIIDHFNKYPLLTQKQADYLLFKKTFEKLKNKEHLTMLGLGEILSIKNAMNLGLTDSLQKAFPDIIPEDRPVIKDQKIKDPN
jgi:hypothetical protein